MIGPISMSIVELEVGVGAQLAAVARPLQHRAQDAPARLDELRGEDRVQLRVTAHLGQQPRHQQRGIAVLGDRDRRARDRQVVPASEPVSGTGSSALKCWIASLTSSALDVQCR